MASNPKGNRIHSVVLLAATELWERFTYYGLRALLVLFFVTPISEGGLALPDSQAAAVYGLFAAAVYLSALPGGWISDRYLGPTRSIWLGGIFIAGGNLLLLVATGLPSFAIGLTMIAAGVGLLKPNVTALVAYAAAREPMSGDSAFTMFYVGINIGGVVGPLVSAALAAATGWRGGFAVSAVGMMVGLATFSAVAPRFISDAIEPRRLEWRVILTMLALALGAYLLCLRLPAAQLLRGALLIVVASAVAGFHYLFRVANGLVERQRVRLMLALFCGASVFWAAGEQAAVTLTLFAERYTDRHVMGRAFPAAWFQSMYPLYVVIFAPVFVWVWQRLATKGREPPNIWKFGVGLLIAAGGVLIAAVAARRVGSGQVGYGWLVVTYGLMALGEILVVPVGLAAGSRLAPEGHTGFSMGLWYLSLSLGGLLAGLIGGVFDISHAPGLAASFTSVAAALATVGTLFLACAVAMGSELRMLLQATATATPADAPVEAGSGR